MLEVLIDSVRVSLMSSQRVIILRQKDRKRYLPIWVGPSEADAITVALQEVELARPLTHDLLKNTLTLFKVQLLRVEIVALKEDIFYANLVLERDGTISNLDARPSDAIALAVRTHASILVDEEVMDEASIVPEQDIKEEEPAAPEPQAEEPQDTADAGKEPRLDVFEDFLKNLGNSPDADDKPEER